MRTRLLTPLSAAAAMLMPFAAWAQSGPGGRDAPQAEPEQGVSSGEIVVTATRREQNLQDVPLSVTAYAQEDLTELGIVGYEGLAQNTPGIVVNRPTANFNNFTSRGVNTNGYSANLQSPVAIYIDELPISANGNSTILDPNLYDVERVEFLRGPQGTLFGSSSLSGAMRILTRSPDLDEFQGSALADLGLTEADSLRQRYNGMINVPLITDKMGFRAVGFYRHEEGYVDNIGTGETNSNTLEDYGGRAILLMEPTDRLSVRLLASYEESTPEDSSLTNPALGERTRRSDRPDLFHAELANYNLTVNYDFDFAELVSSTTLSRFDQLFFVDLAGTFGHAFPFALDAVGYDDIFVQEARLVSAPGGRFDWLLGGFYFDKRRTVDFNYRSSPEFLAARGLTGLSDEYYQRFTAYADQHELAGFGELTYRFVDTFWVTGGLRFTNADVQAVTVDGGFTSNYLLLALFGLSNVPLTITAIPAATGPLVEDEQLSYRASVSWQPTPDVTTYATISTGFRPPVVNAFAGRVSVVDPNDIVIPNGASSDRLTNYEIGLKGRWMDGALTANLAAYFIDWRDIQVQANRLSDQVQFATNIGAAESYGFEFELFARPFEGFGVSLNGSFNEADVTELTPTEAAMSGAEVGARLASPHFQGSATVRYDFALSSAANAFVSANVSHAGGFPNQFPNVPGNPNAASPTHGSTDAWTNVNLYAGVDIGDLNVTAYVENLFDDQSVTYIHPEAFLDGRFARLRPTTVGVRTAFAF